MIRASLVLVFLCAASAFAGQQFKGPSAAILSSTQAAIVASSDDDDPEELEGLSAYWQMEENTGTSTADDAGTHDSQLQNTPTWTTGISGNGLSFALASTEYGVNDNPPVINESTAFSVSAWFKTSNTSSLNVIYSEGSTGSTTPNIHVSVSGTADAICFGYRNDANTDGFFCDGDANVTDGAWHHIVAVQESANSRKLYLDGNLVETNTTNVTTPIFLNRSTLAALGRTIYSSHFDGTLDQVRVYAARALDAAAVTKIFNVQK